jgi:hypothetical protein
MGLYMSLRGSRNGSEILDLETYRPKRESAFIEEKIVILNFKKIVIVDIKSI